MSAANDDSANARTVPLSLKRLSNCLFAAIGAKLIGAFNREPVTLHIVRIGKANPGQRHLIWRDAAGHAFEFYAHDRARRSFIRNTLYLGHVRRAPAFDQATASNVVRTTELNTGQVSRGPYHGIRPN